MGRFTDSVKDIGPIKIVDPVGSITMMNGDVLNVADRKSLIHLADIIMTVMEDSDPNKSVWCIIPEIHGKKMVNVNQISHFDVPDNIEEYLFPKTE